MLGLAVTMGCFIPACAAALARARRAGGVDFPLAVYCAGEIALATVLFRLSTGAWYNYAVQAVIFAGILAARALARAIERPLSARAVVAVALAAVAVPASAFTDVREITRRRGRELLDRQTFRAN